MTMAVPPNIAPPLYISPTAVDLNFLLKDSARNTGRDENISASRNNWIENTMVKSIIFVVYPNITKSAVGAVNITENISIGRRLSLKLLASIPPLQHT